MDRGRAVARDPLAHVGLSAQDLQAVDGILGPSATATRAEREARCISLQQEWESSADPVAQPFAKRMSGFAPGLFGGGARWLSFRPTMWTWSVGSKVPKATSAASMVIATLACGSYGKVQR
jgi:hypothetical protein